MIGLAPSPTISQAKTASMSIEPGHSALRSRPDAVDLVTEEHHTSETVVVRERQRTRSETYDTRRPASRGPEGANVRGETKSGLVQSTAHWVAEETSPVVGVVAVGTVVGLETSPPAQSEIVNAMSLYDDVENDENPWT